jgi:DNA-binding NarL/FixJ family response regulator
MAGQTGLEAATTPRSTEMKSRIDRLVDRNGPPQPRAIVDELFRAVRAAARGESVLSPSVAAKLIGQVRAPAREPLSQRELEVLGLIARGSTNREAAAHLFISEATVKTHLLHIYGKLGVRDRASAVAAAYERGLLTPGSR